MFNVGFDNDKYFNLQTEKILERISHFGGKLYLEFGGNCLTITMLLVFCPDLSPIQK